MTDRSPDAQPHVPRIALTPGEPAGIGPDLCMQLAQRRHQAALVAFADPAMLAERAVALGLPLRLADYDPLSPPAAQAAGTLERRPVGTDSARPPSPADSTRGTPATSSNPSAPPVTVV
jgi:4-hydroxythreonine-4-phosphate dehydrogenase